MGAILARPSRPTNSMSTATPFTFFAIMTMVQFIVVLFFYPETKGQTLEALQRRLMKAD